MSHECPYCGAELEAEDYFGRLAAHQDGKVLGDIYFCPNGRSEDPEVECESAALHVAGAFHTYRNRPDELHEGYPC